MIDSKILILASLLLVGNYVIDSQAFAQVSIVDMHTIPSQVHVGESFRINATIMNNSPDVINFNNGCQSPLSVAFDKNISVNQTMGCFAIYNTVLNPGQNVTVFGPSSGVMYTTILPGTINANVTFSYQTGNVTQNAVSEVFTFDTLTNSIIPEFPYVIGIILAVSVSSIVIISRLGNSF
ncbi:MAG: hypothetical protein KGH76_06045 [Thaumarchaeota archaeon]|nr:hypothetical protein [Nitrososphaerota archaeon]